MLHLVELILTAGLPVNGRADGRLHTWGHLVENNRYGFRERDFVSPKPPGVYRIMVLGDSFTWGVGLAASERYTAVAENLLNSSPPPGGEARSIEVLNFSIPNIPTTRERAILGEYRDIVDPDLIVVGFCFNDPQPRLRSYSIERERLAGSMPARMAVHARTVLRALGLHYLARLPERALYALAERTGRIPPWQVALQRTYETSSTEWADFVQALRDIRRISDRMDLPAPIFAVLNHGVHGSDYSTRPAYLEQYLAWYRQAEGAARDAGFKTYNHELDIPRKIADKSLQVNAQDPHPSAALHRVYGEKLHLKVMESIGRCPGGCGGRDVPARSDEVAGGGVAGR